LGGAGVLFYKGGEIVNNIQSDVILEFQKSIDNMARFGQEMETLDARFGRLDQRIDAMRSSLSGLQAQTSRGAGGNLRQSLTNELNNLISGNGIVLQQLGSAGLTIKRETLQGVFGKVENEINEELRKYVRNLNIEIDPSYASGQKLPISNEDFNEINKEVAKVIKLQIRNLVNAIQKHKSNLIKPDALEGLQITVGKETIMAFVNKIKNEVLHKLANPTIADASDLKITKADMGKVVKEAKTKILKALDVDLPELSGVNITADVKKIPKEIEQNLTEYINKTVAGINGTMAGKAEIPISDLSKKVKRILARELNTTVDQLDKLGSVDLGSVRGAELKAQLERVAKTIDKKLSKSIQEEIDSVVKAINDVEITPEPKLKRHLVNQINRINNALINKIREQVDVQVQSIIQEINEVQSRPRGLNRDAQIRNAGDLDLPRRTRTSPVDDRFSDDTRRRATVSNGTSSSSSSHDGGFGLMSAITNTFRHIMAGSIVGAPMMMMYQAVETFKNVQTEQIKMTQNLMLKYTKDDGSGNSDMAKVGSIVNEVQDFIRQQSTFYGTDYNELYQVGGIGSRLLEDPLEIKKFVQLSAQLQTVDPGSNVLNIANGLETMKAQFGLEMADMEEKVAQPLAAVSNLTNASVEQLIDAMKRSGSTMNNANVDPETAIVLAGTSIQATALEGANIGNFYNSILNRLQSDKALGKMAELGVDPYYGSDDAELANRLQSPEAMQKLQELGLANVTDTGAKILVPADKLFQEIAKKLSSADSPTTRNTYDALFGTYQSSKGAATMHEIMNTFVKVAQSTDKFGKDQYNQMIMTSLDNPLVNANRAKQSVTIAFDAMVQEMTPAINKVSYALLNMAENVTKNAQLFVSMGDIISNVLLGMLMFKGIKWGADKVGANVRPNFERETTRSAFLRNVSALGVGDDIKNMSRKQVGAMQKDPLLERYIRDLNGMSDDQRNHFKEYLSSNKIDAKDLPTMFAAMDESKNWEKRKDLTDDEKFDRTKQYHNRLSTRPDLANVIDPNFLNTMNNSTANRGAFDNHRQNVAGYSSLSDRMSRMSQGEFQGFEDHLVDRQRNGLPPIDDVDKLTRAMDDYESTQRQAGDAARQASPAFGSLSNAVRGMNSEMSRTDRMKNGFKQFLKDIPDLGRGALSSIKNLAGGIAKMALEIAGAIGLAQAAKGIAFNATSTEDQRQLAKADARDGLIKATANTLRINGDGKTAAGAFNRLNNLYNSTKNWIDKNVSGIDPQSAGAGQQDQIIEGIRDMLNKQGAGITTGRKTHEMTSRYIKDNGLDPEELARKYFEDTGRQADTDRLREMAATKQYEQAQLAKEEEERLQRIAKENYEKKYKEGAVKFPSIDADSVMTRISDKVKEVKDNNQIDTLRALMGGMKTDSAEYIALRKTQTASLRQVMNDELAIIDQYISNAKTIMESADPNSQEYTDAKNAYDSLNSARDKVETEGEADILQEEWNNQQEAYQSQVKGVTNSLSKIDLMAQAKELAAAYSMDNESQAYLDAMKQIAVNKMASMKTELENLKAISAIGDLSEDQALQVLQLQNSIANEQAKVKGYDLASIGIGATKIQQNNSVRENELLALKLQAGNPDDSSSILRNKRIANAKTEVSEINQVIDSLKAKLPSAGADETTKINAEIRDLQKQSLQAQLGILDELKATAGTFNMPDGVKAMSRYEYLTRGNTHNTTTIGAGDVVVNITLPNVTNGMTSSQLEQVGQSIGQGLSVGRVGGLRSQQAMNPSNYRS
jgi:hypothetical protein